MDDARGRKPGQKRNPRGGQPYKREYGEPDETAQSNFTDPESRIMKTSSIPAKLQRADGGGGGEPAGGGDSGDGQRERPGPADPMVDAAAQTCGETPAQVLADAGYCNEPDLQALKERIDGYVALGREGGTAAAVDADEHPEGARMAEKLESDEGRRRYARRKWMAEAVAKEVMGFRRFSFRGLEKVQGEWTLVCLALNVKRLHTLQAA